MREQKRGGVDMLDAFRRAIVQTQAKFADDALASADLAKLLDITTRLQTEADVEARAWRVIGSAVSKMNRMAVHG